MISRHLQILSFIALSLAIPCQAASAKTTVDGHHLENTSVGFYGFAVDVPHKYEPYDAPKEKSFKPKSYADLAWLGASLLDQKAGATTLERIPFKTATSGLVVVVTRVTVPIPPVKQEKQHQRMLELFMGQAVKRTAHDFKRDVRKIGDNHVGRVGRLYKGSVIATNMVLIPPSTLLTFYGICAEAGKDDLLADLDSAIATLNTGERMRFAQ